ncbi:hypothetical protein DRE_04690 [Drechslerella stenobrocha 248]|uniref:Histidine kinase n=1 Tax=Drechslerella stenobrocha 248 TaxID=1043628 RepID=W7HPR2_9PEZI|nr:hypothetical protein DRE_04690 [Drechslerella stenobrocha 248]
MASMSPPGSGPHDRSIPSGTNTPASVAFFPPETNPPTPYENPDYPSPNLYELALLLHSEPGIDGFWDAVVRIMREYYKADRLSLTIPTDLTDLTNSPWGQKATYNEADEGSLSLSYIDEIGPAPLAKLNFPTEAASLADRSAPQRMFSQDSVDVVELLHSDTGGPEFSPITINLADQSLSHQGGWAAAPGRESPESLEDMGHQPTDILPAFPTEPLDNGDACQGRVFLNLQQLNYEAEPLVDGAGVSRVLERGKTVVLSREYKDMQTKWERLAAQKEEKNRFLAELRKDDGEEAGYSHVPQTPGEAHPPLAPAGIIRSKNQRRFPYPSVEDFQMRSKDPARQRSPTRGYSFEEFEQAVSSPWSQSPAPSPAIRSDPTENPFFAPAKVDEESFNPSAESPQYSIAEPIHAIGLENSSTVIHVPLIHPCTSIIKFGKPSRPNALLTDMPVKRTPIAILSILSSVIPYPKNLVHSLTHLSPLMATAFALSQAHSNAALQLSHMQFQGPGVIVDQRKQGESIVSVTSPSDYTKSSSATNSLAGTPNQDLNASFGEVVPGKGSSSLASPSVKSSLHNDGYFSSKRPLPKRRSSSGVYQIPLSPGDSSTLALLKLHPSRVEHLIEEATGRPPRPQLARNISEVMEPKLGKQRREGREEISDDSEKEGSVEPQSSEDMATPRAIMTPRTETVKQTTSFFGNPNDSISGELAPAVDAILQTMVATSIKPQYISLPGGDSLPPSPVPQTPSGIPLPETPLHGPPNVMERYPMHTQSSPKHAALAIAGQSVPDRGGALTPVMPSATHDLQVVESALELSAYPLPSPGVEDAKPPESPEAGAHKPDGKKRVPLRRHSSMASSYRHTRLHSRGAEFGASFPTITSSSNLPPTPGYEHMRPASAKTTHHTAPHPDTPQRNMPPPSNKLLRTIIDAIPVHVFTAAPQTGETTWVNSRMLSYRGATAEEFMADPYEPFHPDDRTNIRLWLAAVRKGEPFSYQIRIRRFDGHYRWFMIRAVPLRDNRGIIVHWFGTNMDIHDQRIAEVNAARQAEMAESEAKYRSLANSSPQIVFAATLKGGITFANNQWLEYSGQTLDQALQLGFMEFVHPADRHKCALPGFKMGEMTPKEKAQGAWFKTSPSEENNEGKIDMMVRENEAQPPFSTELRLRRKDGEYRWHLVRCVSVEASNANVEGLWFGTCTDINDHKLLEQRLKDANDGAKKAMESKTRFLSNMSHEIRTPLIGISGMVNFLLDTPLNGEQLDYCHTISSSSDGLLMVINDILDLSKVEAGMMRLSFEWFRVRLLMEDANELLSTMAISKELELNYEVEEDVPAVVSGDRIRLRQVILNIVGNAIKFTSKGEVFTRCYVIKDAAVPTDMVMLGFECYDTGPGFDEKEEELMFKPFSQIDGSSTRAHGGSGLGLVISRQLVELHGGKMTATSKKGEGSTFYFSALCKLLQGEETPSLISSSGTPETVASSTAGLSTESQRALAHPVPSAQDPAVMSRKAIEGHIRTVLLKGVPHEITVVKDAEEGRKLLQAADRPAFSHIVVNLPDYSAISAMVKFVSSSARHAGTTIVVVTTPIHRTAIIEESPALYEAAGARVQFIYKPLKPARLSVIFDPEKQCDASMDRYRHTAQQVVDSQKAVFARMEAQVGHRGHRVLLVEDNLVNQKVLLRFLGRVGLAVETAADGEECVDKVLERGVGYYSLILCDLHMPRKDGFATCAEIRGWERENGARRTPIIALSANVMADVAERCAAAGFSRYVSKPVDFRVLGDTIQELLDPSKEAGVMADFMGR